MSKLLGLVAAVLLAFASPAAAQTQNGAVPLNPPASRAPIAAGSTPLNPPAATVATARQPSGGRLPFTPVDVAVLGAGSLVLVAAGFVLRRLGRPPMSLG